MPDRHAEGDATLARDLLPALSLMNAAVTNVGLYSASHPQAQQYVRSAFERLTELLGTRPEITLLVVGGDLVANNQRLSGSGSGGVSLGNIVRLFQRKTVERLTFVAGMPREDLEGVITDLAGGRDAPVRTRPFIKIGRVEVRVRTAEAQQAGGLSAMPAALQEELDTLTSSELNELKELYHQIKRHRRINVRGVEDVVKGFIRCFRDEANPLALLATIKTSHEYTFTHVANVGILTMGQAESMGFTGEHLHQIGVASLLHDVGKLFIPEEIMNKPGVLTPEERKVMETHTVKGARYLTGLEGVPKLAVLAALEHHLRYDGTGYPAIRGGWRPNIASQVIAVSDVFDAMRSKRVYQESHTIEKIEAVLRKGSGTSFNPLLVENFLRLIKQ